MVVTARKRDESLLEVPVAISAMSAETISTQNVTNLQDVAKFTPSLQINDLGSNQASRANQQIIMRGMYTQVSPSVSVFIDGAPVAGGFVSNIKDAERIEILKGPQTAYFGRQTFAGAINIVTQEPSDEFRGKAEALIGSDDWHDLSLSVEGPLTDWLSGRLMLRDMEKGGQYTNFVDGETLGDLATRSIAVNLKAELFEGFTAKFYGTYWQDRDGPQAVAKLTSTSFNCNAGGAPVGTNNTICGTLPLISENRVGRVNKLSPQFIGNVFGNSSGRMNPIMSDLLNEAGFARNASHVHLDLEYSPASWNGITLSSLTAGNSTKHQSNANLDNQDTRGIPNNFFGVIPGVLPYVLWQSRAQTKIRDFSQEVRLTSNQSDQFRWLFGVNYAELRSQVYVDGFFPYGAGTFGSGGHTETETKAAFFSLAYDITDKLTVNAEGRYQSDKISVFSRSLTAPPAEIASSENNTFLPRLSVQYDLTDRVMVYASYAEGVNPPAFNSSLVGVDPRIVQAFADIYGARIEVDPEYVKDYELGIKGRFFDNRLQLSADVYYMQWSDQILTVFGVVPGIPGVNGGLPFSTNVQVNAGETDLKGIEVDGLWLAAPGLTVDFALTYADTEIKSYPGYVCPGSVCNPTNSPTDVRGNSLAYGPDFAGNIGITYKGQINDRLDYYVRVEDVYKGSRYVDISNLAEIGSSNTVNLRGGLTWGETKLEAFVENLFDDRQYAGYAGGTDIDGAPNGAGVYPAAFQVVMPTMRQFGVKLTHEF